MPNELTTESKKNNGPTRGLYHTINLLDLLSMVVTAWVIRELIGGTDANGDPIIMRVDNMAAVSWICQCWGTREKRASLIMRFARVSQTQGGLESHRKPHPHSTEHPSGRYLPFTSFGFGGKNVRELSKSDEWLRERNRKRGERIFDTVFQTKNVFRKHDDSPLEPSVREAQPSC